MPGECGLKRVSSRIRSSSPVKLLPPATHEVDHEFAERLPSCRICFEDSVDPSVFITPCRCTGTQQYVHYKCLRRWQDALLLNGKNKSDVRAFRCNVCCTRYSLQPQLSLLKGGARQWLRALGAAVWLVLLALGVSSSPWPHVALMVLLLMGATRAGPGASPGPSLLCLVLLLLASCLALLSLQGMRLVLRMDGHGKLAVRLIHHGAPIDHLQEGTVLVASQRLDNGMFAQTAILVTEYSTSSGAKGVVLNSPSSALGGSNHYPGSHVRHMNGGPVGAPGSPHGMEVVLLHTLPKLRYGKKLLGDGSHFKPATMMDVGQCLDRRKDIHLVMGDDIPEVLEWVQRLSPKQPSAWVYHGISAWARGQLEGEIRAGSWGIINLCAAELLALPQGQLWERLQTDGRTLFFEDWEPRSAGQKEAVAAAATAAEATARRVSSSSGSNLHLHKRATLLA